MEVRTKGLDTLNVVADIDLLVGGVSTIVTTTNRKKDNTSLEDILEGKSNRNGTTLSSVIGLNTPNSLGSLGSSSE